MREVVFLAGVIADIEKEIAAYAPERGGLLVGPIGVPVVSSFVPDPEAAATSVTYSPSGRVSALAHEIQQRPGMEVKGIIHSHPGMMNYPSGGDQRSFVNWLDRFHWLSHLITPIVTVGVQLPEESNQIRIVGGIISVHVAEARSGGTVKVTPAQPRVVDPHAVGATVVAALGAKVPDRGTTMFAPMDGHLMAVSSSTDARGNPVTVLVPYTFPFQPPVVLVQDPKNADAAVVALPLTWDLNLPEAARLDAAMIPFSRDGNRVSMAATDGVQLQGQQPISPKRRSRNSLSLLGSRQPGRRRRR